MELDLRKITEYNRTITEFSGWKLVCVNPEDYETDADDDFEDDRIWEFQLLDENGKVLESETGALWDREGQLMPLGEDTMPFYGSYMRMMPVIERIEKLKVKGRSIKHILKKQEQEEEDVEWTFTVEIKHNQCIIHRHILLSPGYFRTDRDFLGLFNENNESKSEAIFLALAAFANWYNQQELIEL